MKTSSKSQSLLFLCVVSAAPLVFNSCAHLPPIQEYDATANPMEETDSLESDLKSAKAEQVDVLSPNNFEKANEAYENARKEIAKKHPAKDALHEVAISRAYLGQALKFAQIARSNMEEVPAARRAAMDARAYQYFKDDFNDADKDLKKVTSAVEGNDLDVIEKERANLQAKYLNLEVRGIQEHNIGSAKELIDTAEKEGAQEFAPRTLAIAKKSLADTEAFIKGNRHDKEAIAQRAKITQDRAEKLVKITRDSKTGRNLSPEEVALKIDQEKASGAENEAELNRQQASTDSLKSAKEALESAKNLQDKFDAAQEAFNDDEAEVYQQGDALVLRLRGLRFPTGKSTLNSDNFPLLAKVQKVIEDFGPVKVTVEGHTDSRGGQELNKRLSQERAKAIKEYLTTNSDQHLQVEAVGYGYERPLASEKTAEGRAINRRVDIVIRPEKEEPSAEAR